MKVENWHILKKGSDLIQVKKGRRIRYWLHRTKQGWEMAIRTALVETAGYAELLDLIEEYESSDLTFQVQGCGMPQVTVKIKRD